MPRFKLSFSPESLREIQRIVIFYNDASTGLGARFKKNLLTELTAIKQNPFTRSFRYDNVRYAVVKKFSYAAHYTIDEKIALSKFKVYLDFLRILKLIGKLDFN
jgi:hypothetical protein